MKKRGEKRTGCCGGGGRETFDRPAIPPANREPRHCFFDVFVAWISREGLKIPRSSTAVTLNSSFSRKRMRIFRFELIFANSLFELPFFTRWDEIMKKRLCESIYGYFEICFSVLWFEWFEWVKVMIECFLNGSKREWERCTIFVWFLVRILWILIVVRLISNCLISYCNL